MIDNNIERVIKQNKPFSSNYLKAEIGLIYLCNQLNSHLQNELKQYNITQQQFNVLRILRGQYPKSANINMIKDRMIDKMSDVFSNNRSIG